jgi:iron complex outermembrane receptor protein
MLSKSLAGAGSLAVVALLNPAPSRPVAAAAPPTTGVEELVVTAQKVEENVQRVPIAVTAFSADRLGESHVETIADLARLTPSFTATVFNPAELNLTIRGIGSAEGVSQNAGGDPSVVVFVDGVYAGRGGVADIDAYNLARVEVLRGPQGTLFGKNAVGGLVQFVSAKPTNTTASRINVTLGNYSRVDVNGYVNAPFTDKVFVTAGASFKSRDGYEFNESTGNRVNDEKLLTVQGALRFLPTDDVDFVLAADYTHQDQKGNPRHNICDVTFAAGVHCVGVNPDPRVVNAYTDGYIRRDLTTVRGELNWTTPIGVVTSLTAYRHVKLGFLTPFFSNPVNPPAQIESTEIDAERNNQFSEEARLAFHGWDNRVDGVAGFYYLREDNNRTEGLIQQFPAPSISGTASYPQHVIGTSTALFGQLNVHITDTLTATAGARMTWEHKDGHFAGFVVTAPLPTSLPPPLGAPGFYDVRDSHSWHAFTPRFALQWQATDTAMIFVSAARGFKSGGYQGIAGTASSASAPYNPEYAWSYELGAKTQWFDNRLRLNASVYRTNYTDLQFSSLIPLCCVVVGNAATARVQGFEVEFVGKLTSELQIDGGYNYLDAKYTKFAASASLKFPGHYLTRSPKNKLNLGVQYRHDFGGWLGTARLDYTYSSKYFFDPNNIPTQTQPAYSMFDGRISVAAPDRSWEVAVWGKNLGDKLVATYVTAFAPYHQVLVPYAPPRTFGVTLSYRMQ